MEKIEKDVDELISEYEKLKNELDTMMKTGVGLERYGDVSNNADLLSFRIMRYKKGVIYFFEKERSKLGLILDSLNPDNLNKPFLINNVPTTLSHEIFKYYMKGMINVAAFVLRLLPELKRTLRIFAVK